MAPTRLIRRRQAIRESGFTFLWLIFALAVAAAGAAAIAQPIQLAAQRDREAELAFRGNQIARALTNYWAHTPGNSKRLPLALDDLVEDRRSEPPLHHLRQLYADPFTGQADWVVLRDEEGRIYAVHSRSIEPAHRIVDLPKAAPGTAIPVSARVFSFAPVASPATSAASMAEPGPASSYRFPVNASTTPAP